MMDKHIATTNHRTMATACLLAVLGGVLISASANAEFNNSDSVLSSEFSLGTAFIYEGTLNQHGGEADGLYDFQYELYDLASGGVILSGASRYNQVVRGGAFATELDFGRSIAGGDLWLEIQVREAGDGAFTTLTPRQLLLGAVATCTVDSDLLVNGQVTISNGLNPDNLYIPMGADVTEAGGGFVTLGLLISANLAIDNNEIMARNNGVASTLHLNLDGGEVRINDSGGSDGFLSVRGINHANLGSGGLAVFGSVDGQNIAIDNNEIMARNNGLASELRLNKSGGVVKINDLEASDGFLYVQGTSDAEPDGGGLAVFGNVSGANVAIDRNEIMARNNGSTSTLFLNNDGGTVVVGGPLDIGWEIVEGSTAVDAVATCGAGTRVLGGGCDAVDFLVRAYPQGNTSWHCYAGGENVVAYAICANVE